MGVITGGKIARSDLDSLANLATSKLEAGPYQFLQRVWIIVDGADKPPWSAASRNRIAGIQVGDVVVNIQRPLANAALKQSYGDVFQLMNAPVGGIHRTVLGDWASLFTLDGGYVRLPDGRFVYSWRTVKDLNERAAERHNNPADNLYGYGLLHNFDIQDGTIIFVVAGFGGIDPTQGDPTTWNINRLQYSIEYKRDGVWRYYNGWVSELNRMRFALGRQLRSKVATFGGYNQKALVGKRYFGGQDRMNLGAFTFGAPGFFYKDGNGETHAAWTFGGVYHYREMEIYYAVDASTEGKVWRRIIMPEFSRKTSGDFGFRLNITTAAKLRGGRLVTLESTFKFPYRGDTPQPPGIGDNSRIALTPTGPLAQFVELIPDRINPSISRPANATVTSSTIERPLGLNSPASTWIVHQTAFWRIKIKENAGDLTSGEWWMNITVNDPGDVEYLADSKPKALYPDTVEGPFWMETIFPDGAVASALHTTKVIKKLSLKNEVTDVGPMFGTTSPGFPTLFQDQAIGLISWLLINPSNPGNSGFGGFDLPNEWSVVYKGWPLGSASVMDVPTPFNIGTASRYSTVQLSGFWPHADDFAPAVSELGPKGQYHQTDQVPVRNPAAPWSRSYPTIRDPNPSAYQRIMSRDNPPFNAPYALPALLLNGVSTYGQIIRVHAERVGESAGEGNNDAPTVIQLGMYKGSSFTELIRFEIPAGKDVAVWDAFQNEGGVPLALFQFLPLVVKCDVEHVNVFPLWFAPERTNGLGDGTLIELSGPPLLSPVTPMVMADHYIETKTLLDLL